MSSGTGERPRVRGDTVPGRPQTGVESWQTRSAEIRIRLLGPSDLPGVAAVHMTAFPWHALTRLGHEAVRRYYEWQLEGPHDVTALGAYRSAECVGFCVGGVFRAAMVGYLKRNLFFLAGRVLTHPWVLAHRTVRRGVRRGLRQLRLRGRTDRSVAGTTRAGERQFRILTIAVDPQSQGAGVGKMLMIESENVAKRRGFREMGLSVHPANIQAIRFYEGLGWFRAAETGGWKLSMRKSLVS